MAKINFCARTAELRIKTNDGRHEEARREAIELLRDGYATRPFLAFVAELLDPQKRGRGQPARPPMHWIEIAQDFHELVDAGSTREQALFEVSERFNCSVETARRGVRIYDEAKAIE